ncbi:hypothetical protein FDN13_10210 [Caloramator sp. E03]|nr:hypothetical protein FDN13_10210 [Caloramator sp. E03]
MFFVFYVTLYVTRFIIEDTIYIYVKSKNSEAIYPYCNTSSDKAYSCYEKSFQDLSIQNKKTKIILKNR